MLAHSPVFSTGCAISASHLEITECRGEESYGKELCTHTYDVITHGRTPPLSSRGSCKPTDEYPYCTEGAMQLGRQGCYPHSQRCHQSCCLLLAHLQNYGAHGQFLAGVNTSTRARTRACGCDVAFIHHSHKRASFSCQFAQSQEISLYWCIVHVCMNVCYTLRKRSVQESSIQVILAHCLRGRQWQSSLVWHVGIQHSTYTLSILPFITFRFSNSIMRNDNRYCNNRLNIVPPLAPGSP